ncbi:methyltransferase domain-containing protein [Clostridium paridis]|uniref:Methyltransferase domain-containing protein n=1 Tax=Clostridium paridis TaxID=2803863 RepID=A0A937FGW7_9CLOT|nr:methyltransferase domain-containing protein [Clostridium paridis]
MEKRNFKSNWDKMVQFYEDFTNTKDSYSSLIEWKAIKTILPRLENKTILDLGCGTGRFSFLLEELNPKMILGIDLSDEMINFCKERAKEKGSQIEFSQGDIENISFIDDNSIDFVFSSTVLHYVKDLNEVMKEINRVLISAGTCILSVINPVYSACYPLSKENGEIPVDDEWNVKYLDRGLRAYIQPWIEYNPNIDNYLSYSYHHTMSDYINSIVKAGLQIEELLEPLPPAEWKEDNIKRYYGYMDTPTYAIFKLKKN